MKIFNHPSTSHDWECPICKTNADKPVVLLPIVGTVTDSIAEAEQFHFDCINLWYKKANVDELDPIIFQIFQE